MEKVLFFRRITVFIQSMVMCSNEVRGKLAKEFPLAHVAPNAPYIMPQPITACPPIADGTPWVMNLFSDGTRVFFNPLQIDIVNQVPTTDVANEKENTKRILSYLGKVVNILEIPNFTRLAYSPVCGIEDSAEMTMVNYFDSHLSFKLPENASKAKERNVSFSFTDRLGNEKFSGSEINVACKLTEGTKSNDKSTTPCLIIESDINTKPEQERVYLFEDLRTFVDESIDLNAKVIDNLLA